MCLPGQRGFLRHLPAMRNPSWVPVAILGGCWLRHTSHIGKRRVRSTVFRTCAQKSETARATCSIVAVLFSCGPGHVAEGTRPSAALVNPARVVSMMHVAPSGLRVRVSEWSQKHTPAQQILQPKVAKKHGGIFARSRSSSDRLA